MRATVEHIEKLVSERHQDVRKNFDALLGAIAENSRAEVINENAALHNSLRNLGAVVAREHWPDWLSELIQQTANYAKNHDNGKSTWVGHLRSLIKNYPLMNHHSWFLEEDKEPVFDADRLIEAARQAHKINDLYDRVISTLKNLADCGELDSAKAIADLAEIIAMMKKARTGSFAGQLATWQFARRFVPNLIGCYLKSSSLAGPAIEAFEQTAQELDVSFQEVVHPV